MREQRASLLVKYEWARVDPQATAVQSGPASASRPVGAGGSGATGGSKPGATGVKGAGDGDGPGGATGASSGRGSDRRAPRGGLVAGRATSGGLCKRRPHPDDDDIEKDRDVLRRRTGFVASVPVPSAGLAALYVDTKKPTGLANLGNTCFVNAVVQVLLRVSPLREVLRGHTCTATRACCAWCALRDQASDIIEGGRRVVPSPVAVLARRGRFGTDVALGPCGPATTAAGKRWRAFDEECQQDQYGVAGRKRARTSVRGGPQCDCEEFLTALLETACGRFRARAAGGVAFASPYDGLCREIFGCLVRYRRGCASVGCANQVKDVCTVEKVVRLQLKGPETETLSLEQLWREHWQEGADGDVRRQCCSSGVGECQQLHLEEEPACLLIVLGRSDVANPVRKLHHSVAFPRRLEWLRIGNYECVGVVHHKGHTAREGHYAATCLTDGATGGYHQFDDNSPPTPCSWTHLEKEEQLKSAYILVYVRVSERSEEVPLARMWPYAVSSKSERERLARAGLLEDVVHLDGAPAAVGRQRSVGNFVGAIARRERGRLQAA